MDGYNNGLVCCGTYSGVDVRKTLDQSLVPVILLNRVTLIGGTMNLTANQVAVEYSKTIALLGQLIIGEKIKLVEKIRGNGNCELVAEVVNPFIADDKRYPLPKDKVALIGYVMEVNKEYYLKHDLPFIQRYVDIYDAWCNSLAYKKDFAARQSNAKSSTTNQNRCYLYYTPTQKKEGGHYDEANC